MNRNSSPVSRTLLTVAALLLSLPVKTRGSETFPSTTPEQEGISSTAILTLVERLEKDVDAVHSLMILRNGNRIAQGWWAPYDAATPHLMHSLSKSFTSTAIGLAIDEGRLSLNDRVISFFPEDTPEEPSWQLKAMRVRDLITMNTGHRREPRLFTVEDDWVRAFLHSEIEFKPGTHFQYNSAATYMLSAIIQKVTGERLVDYLEPRLFHPLDIKKPDWDQCPDGINTGGWGLRITTETIAKLGQLYLQKGQWQGERILSHEWVEMATSKQTSNGSDPNNDWDQGYGFQFWRCRHDCYRGDGAFGQFCIVIPEHDAVVAVTSGANNMGGIMSAVWDVLLPAFKKTPLPANEPAQQALRTKLNALSLSPIQGKRSSPLSKALTQHTFQILDNEAGVRSIRFELHEGEHKIFVTSDHGTEILRLGNNQYLKSQMNHRLPYTQTMRSSIGACGAWTQDDEYQARIYFRESPASITYTFHFKDNKMRWSSELRHALFASRNLTVLEGE